MTNESTLEELGASDENPTAGQRGTTRRYWSIHPGDGAKYWYSFKERSHIGVSWGLKHDLRALSASNQQELRDWLVDNQQINNHVAAARASQLWSFVYEMQPGDMVCAAGQNQLLGWGEVDGDYEYAPDEEWPLHRRSVQWKSLDSRSVEYFSKPVRDRLIHPKSLVSLTEEQFLEIEALGDKRAWLFQANPKYYDIRTNLATTKTGDSERWVVQSYWRQMHSGDEVFIWVSGPDGGLLARGTLLGDPYERDWSPSEEDLQQRPYANNKWWVDMEFMQILKSPIPRNTVKENALLRDIGVLKFPQATNYPLTHTQWHEIQRLFATDVPTTEWARQSSADTLTILTSSLATKGLHFNPWQIATYYTALQTKGFAILSGISGTGKTKLAQHFAELLPQPESPALENADDTISITVQPSMLKYKSLVVPARAVRQFVPPDPTISREVPTTFDGAEHTCRIYRSVSGTTDFVGLYLRGPVGNWFTSNFQVGDHLILDMDIEDGVLERLYLSSSPADAETVSPEEARGENLLFVPVRPDWRDSKSLLGYYNPLTSTYEWTDFLRFLQRTERSYKDGDGLAWFVILDEMNLAHVEYYFADLLSVLESGRIEDGEMRGLTREPLRLAYPEDAEGDLPPKELRLPPNLYVIGTVNVDETTHAFSPKVLDRAFTLEFTDVDFSTYPPQLNGTAQATDADTSRKLLAAFTQDGTFERVDKRTIAAFVADDPEVRDRLQSLNNLLKPHDMHFGYRVFDEIVTFLSAAERNKMFKDEEGEYPALDAAVLMKVLPKFHGSRGRLEAPLRAVLAWCLDPDSPDRLKIDDALKNIEDADRATASLNGLTFAHPRTAARTIRMLRALYTDGFAAFG